VRGRPWRIRRTVDGNDPNASKRAEEGHEVGLRARALHRARLQTELEAHDVLQLRGRPRGCRGDAHRLTGDVTGRARTPVGPEALEERIAGIDAPVHSVRGEQPGRVRKGLQIPRGVRLETRRALYRLN
jgi:hypothetical protein